MLCRLGHAISYSCEIKYGGDLNMKSMGVCMDLAFGKASFV